MDILSQPAREALGSLLVSLRTDEVYPSEADQPAMRELARAGMIDARFDANGDVLVVLGLTARGLSCLSGGKRRERSDVPTKLGQFLGTMLGSMTKEISEP